MSGHRNTTRASLATLPLNEIQNTYIRTCPRILSRCICDSSGHSGVSQQLYPQYPQPPFVIVSHIKFIFLRTLQNARYSESVIYQERPRDLARRRRSNLASIPHRHGAGYGQGDPARTDREEYPSAPLDESHQQTGGAHPAEEFTHPPGAYLSGEHEGWL